MQKDMVNQYFRNYPNFPKKLTCIFLHCPFQTFWDKESKDIKHRQEQQRLPIVNRKLQMNEEKKSCRTHGIGQQHIFRQFAEQESNKITGLKNYFQKYIFLWIQNIFHSNKKSEYKHKHK